MASILIDASKRLPSSAVFEPTDMARKEPADGGKEFEVRAAGGVISRVISGDNRHETAGAIDRSTGAAGNSHEVVIVHRPRYDDWTFPKGKSEVDESDEQTALREVQEETGLSCELGDELPSVRYRDHKGRSKIVRYWSMTVRSGEFAANDEVDQLEWVSPSEAGERLTYDHDVDVLSAFVSLLERH